MSRWDHAELQSVFGTHGNQGPFFLPQSERSLALGGRGGDLVFHADKVEFPRGLDVEEGPALLSFAETHSLNREPLARAHPSGSPR